MLILEPRRARRERLAMLLSEDGSVVSIAGTTPTALECLVHTPVDVLFCAVDAPGIDGFDPLPQLLRVTPALVVVLTPPADTSPSPEAAEQLAIAALERGAWDVLAEPDRPSSVRLVHRRALEHARGRRARVRLHDELSSRSGDFPIVAASDEMIDLLEQLDQTATAESAVLISGERGSGKESIARALHAQSARRRGPFVRIDCVNPRSDRILSELFGESEQGLGSGDPGRGPLAARRGRYEEALGGMLYLDEITHLPGRVQSLLIHALEAREIHAPDTAKPVPVDVRVVAGTSVSPEQAVAAGQLLPDLLERLDAVRLRVPPLRERRVDLSLIVDHLLRRLRNRRGERIRRIPDDTLESLLAHSWPGNIRELALVLERAAFHCDGDALELDCLPGDLVLRARGSAETEPTDVSTEERTLHLKPARRAFEAELIRRALARTDGNRTHAARLLAISHRSLLYKIRDYGLRD